MEFYQDLWNKTRYRLSNSFAEQTFNEVFGEVKKVVKVENGLIYVQVPSVFVQTKINGIYIKMISEILSSLSNQKLKFKFVCENQIPVTTYKPLTTKIYKNNLKSNYTFESMVIGEANRMSYISAMKVAEQPGTFFNPLYIFGGVGLGKTHLMQAIGNYISDNNLDANILYVQATDFRSDYAKAVQAHNFLEFTQKYENLDVLLIDDIQMLSGADKSQEEFFKLFNDLSVRGKQIVITSDCPASKLSGIMPRLTSRFQMGLSVDVHQPDLNQRISILKRKLAEISEQNLDDEILKYIAENFTDNVRELEGALNRVLGYSQIFSDSELTLDLAKEALDIFINSRKPKPKENYENTLSVIASIYNITTVDLLGKSRKSNIVIPRQIAMYLLYYHHNLKLERIGEILNRDYTSVINGRDKIKQELETNVQIKLAVDNILKKI